ncbi:VOC family protein [Streptomyces sp. A7024]|uniref:VOC family protein n=1 Tax=Streptomyces coryli TaxID=1128680 RepID=A0A6G4U0W1_9ACTN|nr:VOC family protein [Streptomyces coryli]NGN65018.1 VOC family protein [Streptomyces coryli]
MDITIHASFLPHEDPDVSLAFYRDALGFEVREVRADDGWITVGPPGKQDPSIVLRPPGAEHGVTAAERRTIVEMMAKGTYAAVELATADLDAAFARLLAAGAEVVHGPVQQPDGGRECAVRDPAGNLLRIRELR